MVLQKTLNTAIKYSEGFKIGHKKQAIFTVQIIIMNKYVII